MILFLLACASAPTQATPAATAPSKAELLAETKFEPVTIGVENLGPNVQLVKVIDTPTHRVCYLLSGPHSDALWCTP